MVAGGKAVQVGPAAVAVAAVSKSDDDDSGSMRCELRGCMWAAGASTRGQARVQGGVSHA